MIKQECPIWGTQADIENVSHFDVRQFNQIRWNEKSLEEAKKEIQYLKNSLQELERERDLLRDLFLTPNSR